MERTVRRNEPHGYAEAVSNLWERVGGALVRLERVAESPAEAATDDFLGELPHLQYGLHAAAELAVGIDAPRGAEMLHEELVAALAEARDVTADVGRALEDGDPDLVEPLLPEWRGALFRVRRAPAGHRADDGPDRLRRRRGAQAPALPRPAVGLSARRHRARHRRRVPLHRGRRARGLARVGGRPRTPRGRLRPLPALARLRPRPRSRRRGGRAPRPGRAARGSRRGPARPSSR